MDTIELLTLAAEARLAQLDLDAVHLAARVDQATDREVEMAVAERDSALDFYEEAEALADEATPLGGPRPWQGDDAYVPDFEEVEVPATGPSGYAFCACRDCFDVTIGGSVCHHCEEAGCSDDGDQECYRDDAYEG